MVLETPKPHLLSYPTHILHVHICFCIYPLHVKDFIMNGPDSSFYVFNQTYWK